MRSVDRPTKVESPWVMQTRVWAGSEGASHAFSYRLDQMRPPVVLASPAPTFIGTSSSTLKPCRALDPRLHWEDSRAFPS